MKYLFIDFTDAQWYSKQISNDNRDFINEFGVSKSRIQSKGSYKEPITYHQVSGMLHVLLGERPKPSLRDSAIESIDEITEIAKNSYLKYTNCFINGDFPITEIVRMNKGYYGSNSTETYMTWAKILMYLGYELFNEFIEITKLTLNIQDPKSYTFEEICDMHFKNENAKLPIFIDFFVKVENAKRSAFPFFIIQGYSTKFGHTGVLSCRCKNAHLLINTGIEHITSLSGRIVIPLPDKYIDKIINYSSGTPTLLSKGNCEIVDLINDYELNPEYELNDFQRIGDISTEIRPVYNTKTKQ